MARLWQAQLEEEEIVTLNEDWYLNCYIKLDYLLPNLDFSFFFFNDQQCLEHFSWFKRAQMSHESCPDFHPRRGKISTPPPVSTGRRGNKIGFLLFFKKLHCMSLSWSVYWWYLDFHNTQHGCKLSIVWIYRIYFNPLNLLLWIVSIFPQLKAVLDIFLNFCVRVQKFKGFWYDHKISC